MEEEKKEEKFSFKKASNVMKWYWRMIREYQGTMVSVMLLYGFGTIIADVITVVIYKRIIDIISAPGPADTAIIFKWFWMLVVCYALFFTMYRTGDRFYRIAQVGSFRSISNYLFAALEKYSYDFYSNRMAGSLTTQVSRFARGFQNLFDAVSFNIWSNLLHFIAIIITVYIFSPLFAGLFAVFIILMLPITLTLLKRRMYFDELEAKASTKTTGLLSDVISNILTVKMFSAFNREKGHFSEYVDTEVEAQHSSFRAWNLMTFFQNGLVLMLQMGVLGGALYAWLHGAITAGTVVLLFTFTQSIFNIFWQITRGVSTILSSISNSQEMTEILELEADIKDSGAAQGLSIHNGRIQFSQISFSYSEGGDVFKNLNIDVAPGEKLGLIGPSGGGKTTVTKLLLRFIDPQAGEILIDGQNIRNIRQDDLRRSIAYVPQEPLLFHRSLYENIAYGKPEASREEVIEAAKKAHAHEFIEKLEKGYETMVGERGVKLSGGQRQRVAIARAILKDAPILVLDEATSALDTVSEIKIREALDELMREKTAIIIAHRLSTVEKLDRIIVLNREGKIEEEGTHAALVAKDGLYAELWRHQSGGFLEDDAPEEEEA